MSVRRSGNGRRVRPPLFCLREEGPVLSRLCGASREGQRGVLRSCWHGGAGLQLLGSAPSGYSALPGRRGEGRRCQPGYWGVLLRAGELAIGSPNTVTVILVSGILPMGFVLLGLIINPHWP